MHHLGALPSGQFGGLPRDDMAPGPSRPRSPPGRAGPTAAFIDALADPALWPPMAQRARLTSYLSQVLLQWPAWPRSLGLDVSAQGVYNDEAPPSSDNPSHACLHRLVVTCRNIEGDDRCSVYYSPGPSLAWLTAASQGQSERSFPGAPNGFFEAVAAGLDMAGQSHLIPGLLALPQSRGQQLRTLLAQWLRHAHAGAGLPPPADLAWTRWPAPAWRAPPVAAQGMSAPGVAVPADSASPSSGSPASARGLAPRMVGLHVAAGSQATGLPVCSVRLRLPPPCTGPAHEPASVAQARQLLDKLRHGYWHAEMLAVVLPAFAAISWAGLMGERALPRLRLVTADDGPRRRCGGTYLGGKPPGDRIIEMSGTADAPQFRCVLPGQPSTEDWQDGVDGLMLAFLRLLSRERLRQWVAHSGTHLSEPHAAARTLRRLLADWLDDHPDHVRLCMSIERLWPTHPEPDRLLRQCLDKHALTLEGRQVLDRSLVSRRLESGEDIKTLYSLPLTPCTRRQGLFDRGYDVIRASELTGLLRRPATGGLASGRIPPEMMEAVAAEIGRYLHVYGSWSAMMAMTGVRRSVLERKLGTVFIAGCESVALEHLHGSCIDLADRPRGRLAAAAPPDAPQPAPPEGARAGRPRRAGTADMNAPACTVAEAQAVVQSLRTGPLTEEGLVLTCHALTRCRLARLKLRRLPALVLAQEGLPERRFASGYCDETMTAGHQPVIHMRGDLPDATFHAILPHGGSGPGRQMTGLDGLMVAYHSLALDGASSHWTSDPWADPGPLDKFAQSLRHSLADVLDRHIEVVRVCLTLQRRWADHDKVSLMLRQCLDAGELTWEGLQVIAPALVSLPLQDRTDVEGLAGLAFQPGERREALFRRGYPLLQAHELLGPLGLTPAAGAPPHRPGPGTVERLSPEAGWLLHAQGSWTGLAAHLGMPVDQLKSLVGAELVARWEFQARTLRAAAELHLEKRRQR